MNYHLIWIKDSAQSIKSTGIPELMPFCDSILFHVDKLCGGIKYKINQLDFDGNIIRCGSFTYVKTPYKISNESEEFTWDLHFYLNDNTSTGILLGTFTSRNEATKSAKKHFETLKLSIMEYK